MQSTSRTKPNYTKRPSAALRGRVPNRRVRRSYEQRSSIKRKVLYDYESTKKAAKKRFLALKVAFPVMACVIFAIGIFVAMQGQKVNQQVEAQVNNLQQATSGDVDGDGDDDVPDETPVGNIQSYTVAPDQPRFIRVAKLGVEARVLRLGVTANNELDAPNNIYDVGWYEGSSKPGKHGAMLVDGHVHGPTTPGVFYGLKDLVAGDNIEVERGDGKKFTYKVVKSETYDANNVDMNAALVSAEQGRPGLNLITCTGNVNYAESSYDQRIIVFAVLE